MVALDKVKHLKEQGYTDSQIARALQEEGISPREINESLAQVKIKEAVTNPPFQPFEEENNLSSDMQPSLMDNEPAGMNPSQQEGQYTGEMYLEAPEPGIGPEYMGQSVPESYTQQTASYPQEAAYEGNYGGGGGGGYSASAETITEITSQIVDEKLKKTMKVVHGLNEFKTLSEEKIEKIDQRLHKIESIMDQMQVSLLRKSFGQEQNIDDIKTEMIKMQEGFSKVLNPLVDIEREIGREKTSREKLRKAKR